MNTVYALVSFVSIVVVVLQGCKLYKASGVKGILAYLVDLKKDGMWALILGALGLAQNIDDVMSSVMALF